MSEALIIAAGKIVIGLIRDIVRYSQKEGLTDVDVAEIEGRWDGVVSDWKTELARRRALPQPTPTNPPTST